MPPTTNTSRTIGEERPPSETWRPIVGYEGLYEVSDDGWVRTRGGKVLRFGMSAGKGRPSSTGYRTVVLYRDAKPRRFKVHHLVTTAFIGPRPDGMECNHKDGDRLNNHASNLEWVTQAANHAHAMRMGLVAPELSNVKLTADAARRIRELRGQVSQQKLAEMFGVDQTRISQIQRGRGWSE